MATSHESIQRYLERAFADYLAGRKTQRTFIGDIQGSNMRGKALAVLFTAQKGAGDAAKWDLAYRECETRGWLK